MKKDYIRPTVVVVEYEYEAALLENSIQNALTVPAAPDLDGTPTMKPGSGSGLGVDNSGNDNDFMAKPNHSWSWDD